MTALPRPPLISVADYLAQEAAAEGKHEYLGGKVYAMAGAKNRHNQVALNFAVAMASRLRGQPCGPFNSDTKVRIQTSSGTRFYYPDGMVVCERNDEADTFQDHPVVVMEVLSESTRSNDEREKFEGYLLLPSLRVYLLVETERPEVTVYRRGDDGVTEVTVQGLEAVIDLAEVGAALPLSELYERVDFAAGG